MLFGGLGTDSPTQCMDYIGFTFSPHALPNVIRFGKHPKLPLYGIGSYIPTSPTRNRRLVTWQVHTNAWIGQGDRRLGEHYDPMYPQAF